MEYFMENFDYIMRNYEALKQEISELSDKYKREITLVAVTKSATDEELWRSQNAVLPTSARTGRRSLQDVAICSDKTALRQGSTR